MHGWKMIDRQLMLLSDLSVTTESQTHPPTINLTLTHPGLEAPRRACADDDVRLECLACDVCGQSSWDGTHVVHIMIFTATVPHDVHIHAGCLP